MDVHHDPPMTPSFAPSLARDGAPPTCGALPSEGDGHFEFAFGGAFLLAGETKAHMCWDTHADHAPQTSIYVHDTDAPLVGASFTVYVDSRDWDLVPEEMTCGDHEHDAAYACVTSCTPPFPPGLDGAYHVVVHHAGGGYVDN